MPLGLITVVSTSALGSKTSWTNETRHVCGIYVATLSITRFLIYCSSFSFVPLCAIGWCLLHDPWHCLPNFLPFTKPSCKLAMPVSGELRMCRSTHLQVATSPRLATGCWTQLGWNLVMLIEAVLSDSGLWTGKGKGAGQTLAGCQSICQTCDIAHTWRQLLLPQLIPARHWNKQAGQVLCTTDPAQAQNSYVTHRQLRSELHYPGKQKKGGKIKTSQLWFHLLPVTWLRVITCSTGSDS